MTRVFHSFFDQQSGDFDLVLRGIAAGRKPSGSSLATGVNGTTLEECTEYRPGKGGYPAVAEAQPRGLADAERDDEEEDEDELQKPAGQDQVGAAGHGRDSRKSRPSSWWRGVFCGLL